MDRFDPSMVVTGIFMLPGCSKAQVDGRYRHLPVCYSGFVDLLRSSLSFDLCVAQVSPPNRDGLCSLGAAVEFTPLALGKSRLKVGIVNRAMPFIPGADSVACDAFDFVVETDSPLREYRVGRPSAEATVIAGHIAQFVGDGAALQVGLGKVPDALISGLTDRRGLRLQSGMLPDGARRLHEAGSLDPDWQHMACVMVGSHEFYSWLDGRPEFAVRDCSITHDFNRLSIIPGLVAVNSALEVDLFGQANLEIADGRSVSGLGGAPDLARSARRSPGGVSIIALPAETSSGGRSRVVPLLDHGVASLSRADIDVIATEYGAADLRGKSVHERAEAMIAIAAPSHRGWLTDMWRDIREKL
jgi:acyl-CoA hydrolase